MLLDHAYRLAEARTYLVGLAAQAQNFDARIEYGRCLLELDALHGDQTPGLLECPTDDGLTLFAMAVEVIEELLDFGDDALSIELLLDLLTIARSSDTPPPVGDVP